MKITLIKPPNIIAKGQVSFSVVPPIGLAYITATLLKAGHDVQAIDSVGEDVFRFKPYKKLFLIHGLEMNEIIERIDPQTNLIGISTMFSHEWPHTKILIEQIKKTFPSVPIILGGEHATALAEYILETTPQVDCCVLGEGDETITELAQCFENKEKLNLIKGLAYRSDGKVFNSGLRPRIKEIDSIPQPAWKLFPVNNYLDNDLCSGVMRGRSMPIIFSRGCPYECTFCSNPTMWTQRWIARDPTSVLKEMKDLIEKYGATNFDCCDLTAIIRKDWIIKFTTLLIENNLNITWQLPSGTRTEAINAEICKLIYRSGCKNLVYAPESGSSAVLKRVKKKVQLDQMEKSIKNAIKANINVRVNLVLGFPEDTHKDIRETFKFIFRLAKIGVHDIAHFIFTPYPGSQLFQELTETGNIPELTDEYFLDLLTMADFKKAVSYAKNITNRQLAFYRIFSLIWFYSLMFIFRPWRLFKIFSNIIKEKPESRMEMALKNIIWSNKSKFNISYIKK